MWEPNGGDPCFISYNRGYLINGPLLYLTGKRTHFARSAAAFLELKLKECADLIILLALEAPERVRHR